MIKAGDWVTHSYGKGKVKSIYTNSAGATEMEFTNGGRLEAYLCELWKAKEGEWCWFNMEFADGWQNPVLMKYGEQDTSMWSVEPFRGELPNFIKDKQ